MKIVKVIVKNYIRLGLKFNSSKKVCFTFNELIQIILGTNGSGKSSLLSLLLPKVLDKDDFDKNGYCELVVSHNDKTYRLISTKKASMSYQFLVNDVNLNEGGTALVQKQLIFEHFSLDQDIVGVLLASDTSHRFTTMSKKERADWMYKLCPINTDFALTTYKLLQVKQREIITLRKQLDKRISLLEVELNTLTKDVNVNALHDDVNKYRDISKELLILSNKNYNTNTLNIVEMKIKSLVSDYKNILSTIVKEYKHVFHLDIVDVVNDNLTTVDLDSKECSTRINNIDETLSYLENLVDSVHNLGVDDIDELIETKKQLEINISRISNLNYKKYDLNITDTVSRHTCLNIIGEYTVLLNNISGSFMKFDRQKINEFRKDYDKLLDKINQVSNVKSKIEIHLSNIKSSGKVNCPKCNESFIPNLNKDKLSTFEDKLIKCTSRLKELEEDKVNFNDILQVIHEHEESATLYREFIQTNYQLGSVFKITNGYLRDNDYKSKILTELEEVRYFINIELELQSAIKKLNDINILLTKFNGNAEGIELYTSKIRSLYEDRHLLEVSMSALLSKKSIFENDKKLITRYQHLTTLLNNIDEELNEYTIKYIDNMYFMYIDNMCRDVIVKLGNMESLDSNIQETVRIIDITKKEKESLDLEEKALFKLMEVLDNVIEDMLFGSIYNFVEHMNKVISYVWTYDFKILPCGQESGELDYKFPHYDGSKKRTVKDIMLTSTGQSDIINFAFRLVVMQFLKLEQYPLFLDEFASTFDTTHQERAMNFLKLCIDTMQVSQMFFISHIVHNHGVFTNTETIVLDSNNIVVPQIHNTGLSFID